MPLFIYSWFLLLIGVFAAIEQSKHHRGFHFSGVKNEKQILFWVLRKEYENPGLCLLSKNELLRKSNGGFCCKKYIKSMILIFLATHDDPCKKYCKQNINSWVRICAQGSSRREPLESRHRINLGSHDWYIASRDFLF